MNLVRQRWERRRNARSQLNLVRQRWERRENACHGPRTVSKNHFDPATYFRFDEGSFVADCLRAANALAQFVVAAAAAAAATGVVRPRNGVDDDGGDADADYVVVVR